MIPFHSPLTRRRAIAAIAGVGAACLAPACSSIRPSRTRSSTSFPAGKFVVAHRGNSGRAPENTLPAYRIAIDDGAEYVEQDLQITKDGQLVCCHDLRLDRISDAPVRFPELGRTETVKGKKVKNWYIHDLTLKQIKELDAGSWFDPKYKGTRIPTWDEAIDFIKGRAGLCPETKGPEYYGKLGFDMERLVAETLHRHGLDRPKAWRSTPLLMQSFSRDGLVKLSSAHGLTCPMLWLGFVGEKWADSRLDEAQRIAQSIGPYKRDVDHSLCERAHARGLKVIPFTFNTGDAKGFASVREEMSHYLHELGVDGLFTDNPDQFPRSA